MDDFADLLAAEDAEALSARIAATTPREAAAALARGGRRPEDLRALLSPAAEPLLEAMARRAHDLTVRHFGRTVQLFTPLYLANHCTNRCRYCGFHAGRVVARRKLTPDEIDREARAIAATGLRQVLALTGDAPAVAGVDYLVDAVRRLAAHFPSLGVEVYALTRADYARLAAAGVESMTMFQETYHAGLYATLHPAGPKADFAWRLDAPARAAAGGMRSLGLGALLGLDDWRRDVYRTARHADWLERRFPEVTAGFSLPRLRPVGEGGAPADYRPQTVDDRALVQAMAALRLFMPSAPITISTRESAALRDRLVGLGVTRMSAGVSTAVGGHAATLADGEAPPQFAIDDARSVDEMVAMLAARGYQAVMKDWEPLDGAEASA